MTEDTDLNGTEYPVEDRAEYPAEDTPAIDTPVEAKKPAKSRRLILIGFVAFIAVVAVMVFTQMPRAKPKPPALKATAVAIKPAPAADPAPIPVVQVAWEGINLGAMPADAAQDLKSGKYYYDNRIPGNFGMAIGYWKQAMTQLSGTDRDGVTNLVAAAENELAGQFRKDSGDVVVLIKQGKRVQAVNLLTTMRANFLDITDHHYIWTSAMLARWRP